uniref:Uncharacterized protein n=1 Tax=Mycobacterium riyadhense TaxID=486698 RepID=A0A653EIB8_9MYCO|nr:hypothetical protein BIN_B_01647 [Mycobacterium riyadhense]
MTPAQYFSLPAAGLKTSVPHAPDERWWFQAVVSARS